MPGNFGAHDPSHCPIRGPHGLGAIHGRARRDDCRGAGVASPTTRRTAQRRRLGGRAQITNRDLNGLRLNNRSVKGRNEPVCQKQGFE